MNRAALAGLVGAVALSVGPWAQAAAVCENGHARLDADFEGARMSSCTAGKRTFNLRIDPEDRPINPSPWYAFRVTPKQRGELRISMAYSDSRHRYGPKRSADGRNWRSVDPERVHRRHGGRKVAFRLNMEEAPFIVAAQELLTTRAQAAWTEAIAERVGLRRETIGRSVEGRPLTALKSVPSAKASPREYVLFLGRQHPPEVTGALAMLTFLETVFSDRPLAVAFRERFHIVAVPMINPDGVAHGHWRHNANGVDLNRDWGRFTQPETRSVGRILDEIESGPDNRLRLMLDFHSTRRNVFYVQAPYERTRPPGFTQRWLSAAKARLGGYAFRQSPHISRAVGTAKGHVHSRFGAPSITYELGYYTERPAVHASSVIFAEEMMKTLLRYDAQGRFGVASSAGLGRESLAR